MPYMAELLMGMMVNENEPFTTTNHHPMSQRIRVGIFFGGPSREREISFAGGRTVYDNLDKALFEPVPVFVDGEGRFTLLEWPFLYKGAIRDFYPPAHLAATKSGVQLYAESLGQLSEEEHRQMAATIGTPLRPEEFALHFEVAFLALHGPGGEDGSLQGLLEWYGIPYTGSGILPSAIGIDKAVQQQLFTDLGFARPRSRTLSRAEWAGASQSAEALKAFCGQIGQQLGWPVVVKAVHQGSSIGVTVVKAAEPAELLRKAVNRAFFIEEVRPAQWLALGPEERRAYLQELADLRYGIGLPVRWEQPGTAAETIWHPDRLAERLNGLSPQDAPVRLIAKDSAAEVLLEQFVHGQEFSCIVIQDAEGKPVALPPTGIRKPLEVFDYRSKYLPGKSRKQTPIELPEEDIRRIGRACEALFAKMHFNVYARIDGFFGPDGSIWLNDPNTTSGMMPSSFFFHQAAEIGLDPSRFLTYLLHTSLKERRRSGKRVQALDELIARLEQAMQAEQQAEAEKIRVAVVMGGYSSERHISVESGRNIYEKLASSTRYKPLPVFLTGAPGAHELFLLPVNMLLKDNADDIAERVRHALSAPRHPVVEQIIGRTADLTARFAAGAIFTPQRLSYAQLAQMADQVFIALHGRPGEDGELQEQLEAVGLSYNGSGVESSRITIDKLRTKEILRQHGFKVAEATLVTRLQWLANPQATVAQIEGLLSYPFIAKPSDDGCSSAVKKIRDHAQLEAYIQTAFRTEEPIEARLATALQLDPLEEFPRKEYFMAEELVTAQGAEFFLEVTGGLLTRMEKGERIYEMFEPSETLASRDILSLEEKFLAGEGQNITPARYTPDPERSRQVSALVREDLRRASALLNIEGYARIDAFVRIYPERVETIIIEVNSLPGMTPATCIFHQCAINGYKPYEFIDRILAYGRERLSIGVR